MPRAGAPRQASTVPLVAGMALLIAVAAAQAQSAPDTAGQIEATVTTQGGTVELPGVLLLIHGVASDPLVAHVSDDIGRATFTGLPAGDYRISAALEGFEPVERRATLTAGGVVPIAIDMPIAAVSERVEVTTTSAVSETGSIATAERVSSAEAEWLAPGGGVAATLKLLPSVIATASGESINGGRPSQAAYQIGLATLVDPATNVARVFLPADAIDSVAVLPNPYEVEFGRFSSGLVVVQTRHGANRWKVGVNNTIPSFRTRRFTVANIDGIGEVRPSVEAGGPLVPGRVFLEQTAQYHWDSTDVPSRPESELKQSQWYGALTRVDANLSARHTLAATVGFDRSDADRATLGTFTPPDASLMTSDRVGYALATERAVVRGATFLETTTQVHQYRTSSGGHGLAPMELRPETTLGSFFNRQRRDASAVQLVETVSTSRRGPGGLHLVKIGGDVLASTSDGTSISAPVLIVRSDGSLARRLDFSGPTTQAVRSVDAAAFVQDRLQPSARWLLEFGGRVDRDGITGRTNAAPRAGAALVLNGAATAVLRGGYGVFYERTPSLAGAFTAFETATDSRFAADGLTLLGPPTPQPHVVQPLRTARGTAWDVAYTQQLSPWWAVHASVLDRRGSHELVLDPGANGSAALTLSSHGRSAYLREEVGLHLTRGTRMDVSASYVHASARENLNAFGAFYGSVRAPIVGADAYAPAAADAPRRVLVRGHAMPTARWMLVGAFDWRDGLPYSVVNEALDFVGARNDRRFPAYARTELGLDRRVWFGHVRPWIGVRAANAFGAFLPTDVQSNLGSPDFGRFYNSEYRQIRIHIRFEH